MNVVVMNPCPFQKFFPSQLNRDETFFMKMAFNQAIEAWRKDEVPVGAIITYKNEIIASAHNGVESSRDPTAHAEMLAITQAAHFLGDWRLNDAILYVTKEPCPMCAGATIMSRIRHVYFAFRDPKMGCLGSACDLHVLPQLNHRVQVTSGILEKECYDLMRAYFEIKRKGVAAKDLEYQTIDP